MGGMDTGGVSAARQFQTESWQPAAPAAAEKKTAPSADAGQADRWTPTSQEDGELNRLLEMIRESRERTKQHSKELEKFYKSNKPRYGDAPREAYARLARAKNRSLVNAASGFAGRRMAQLKRELRRDTGNAAAIRAAISQLQKAINRGERKKRDLDREKLLEAQRARSRREQERREEERLRLELQRRKALRLIRENGYIQEADTDGKLHAHFAQQQLDLRRQVEAIAPPQGPSPEAAAQQYAAAAAETPTLDEAAF